MAVDRRGARHRCVVIATTIADPGLHEHRFRQRTRSIEGCAYALSWAGVLASAEEYEPADDSDLIVDTSDPLDVVVDRVMPVLTAP